MSHVATARMASRVCAIEGLNADATGASWRPSLVPTLIVGSWATLLAAQATGTAAVIHHHALIEGGPPLWVAVPLFLVAWQVMVTAMMLPASLPAVRAFRVESQGWVRPDLAVAIFLGAYGTVWAVFGLLAFMADFTLHQVVDASPWLAAHPWLIEAAVLALAGGYQFVPIKQRALAACRHRGTPTPLASIPGPSGAALGLRHGLECLGSSWAVMLVMFAAGFASLWSMAGLTVLMVYETRGRYGQRAAKVAGIILLLAALTVVSGPGPGGP